MEAKETQESKFWGRRTFLSVWWSWGSKWVGSTPTSSFLSLSTYHLVLNAGSIMDVCNRVSRTPSFWTEGYKGKPQEIEKFQGDDREKRTQRNKPKCCLWTSGIIPSCTGIDLILISIPKNLRTKWIVRLPSRIQTEHWVLHSQKKIQKALQNLQKLNWYWKHGPSGEVEPVAWI